MYYNYSLLLLLYKIYYNVNIIKHLKSLIHKTIYGHIYNLNRVIKISDVMSG